jgi:phospholipase/lecithinase/hemolysin
MKIMTIIKWLFTVACLAALPFSSAISNGATFKPRLLVFGDSFVDVGNDPVITFLRPDGSPGLVIPPPTRYDRGRFANGPVVVDYLASHWGILLKPSETGFDLRRDSVSYAYGGAETGDWNLTPAGFPVSGLLGQVGSFAEDLSESGADTEKTTFIVWAGANDYLNALNRGETPDPYTIVGNILEAVEQLATFGANLIVVANLSDLGSTPLCNFLNVCDELTALTEAHNALLKKGIGELKGILPGKLALFDAHKVLSRVTAHPERFGFSNDLGPGPASGCLFQDPVSFDPSHCGSTSFNTDQIFWDEAHPTTQVHKILARKLRRVAAQNRYPHHRWMRY